MHKISLVFVSLVATVSFVSAQDSATSRPVPTKNVPMMTTGNANLDEQIKALNREMEQKIKAIHDEYQAKLKVLIGEARPQMVRPDGSTTTPGMRREVMERKVEIRERVASTTDGILRPGLRIGEMRGMGGENGVGLRVQNFFRGIFGN